MIHRCLSSRLPSQEQEHWASWVLLNLLLSRFGHISLVQRNLTKAYSGLFRGTKKHFKGHHYTFVFVPRGIFFFWRKSITNLGGQATQSASWISLYFVSTLHMTMKGCDILTGSRLHQAVHNELENNKIQMLSQVNTSLLSKVNQIRRILLQVFFLLALLFYVKVSSSLLALQCSSNTVKPLVLFSCVSGTESQILKKTSHLHEWL